MKKSFVLVASGILAILASATQAAPLANAKILNLGGTVTVHQGGNAASAKALNVGDILTQSDVITTGSQSTVKIAFSNGSVIDLDPNTQIELQILKQKPYQGQRHYQQLDRDPSQSITLLSMNYGSLFGHVKKLTQNSKFNVSTPFGVTVIKGTRFRVAFNFDSLSRSFRFLSNNIDGIIEVVTTTDGTNIDYDMETKAVVELTTDSATPTVKIPVPPAHMLAVTLSADDPRVEEIVDFAKNLAPDVSEGTITTPPVAPRPPVLTDDSEVVSPSTES